MKTSIRGHNTLMHCNVKFLPITDIFDNIYDREKLLVEKNIKSFAPSLRFEEAFAESQQELGEYRNFLIIGNKKHSIWNSQGNSFFKEIHQKEKDYIKETGDNYGASPIKYLARENTYRWKNKIYFENLWHPYQKESLNLWREEIARSGVGKQ